VTTGTTGWAPPTEIERLLYEAREGIGSEPLPAVLSRSRLFLTVGRLHADTPGSTALPAPVPDPLIGKRALPVSTAGMLPPWHPEWVQRSVTLAELARQWPDECRSLVVNPGTPCAVVLDARRSRRRTWAEAAVGPGGPPRGLLITDTTRPRHGALAHGLACGAHLSVHNSVAWNGLATTYLGYFEDARTLRDVWRVTNRARFLDTLESLRGARLCGKEEALVLGARSALARHLGRTPGQDEWLDSVARTLRARGAGPGAAAEAAATVRRIAGYEERFRVDGLLGDGERVDSLSAFDYGRIVVFARLALGARLCTPEEAEQAVLAAGRLSRESYGSWRAFSAAYALARVLMLDEGEFGPAYEVSVAQHRVLLNDPTSPYRSVPWS
jgi:hypothetical protein